MNIILVRRHRRLLVVVLALVAAVGWTEAARADLLDYVKQPDPAFSWKLNKKIEDAQGTVYDFHLVSQVWQGIPWEHQLQVYLPKGMAPTATMFLWNQGGGASAATIAFGMDMAKKMRAPCAFLYHIPNQPLLDGKKEDTLIAETFVRYLNTKDENWPLLFPMVKSLVRAMDALQEFAQKEWQIKITGFVVSGGSKRGWTCWLTGIADRRVQAIAPMVIDTLNFQAQLPHQLRSFSKYSEMIGDYTRRGLVPLPDTPEAKRLWRMVDPWAYRDRLKIPVMIINGANDPYWSLDALNLYWNDLKMDKRVLYVPNAGHDLVQRHEKGGQDRNRAVGTLAAFARHQIHRQPLPTLTWQHDDADGQARLTVKASPAPKAARLWLAKASSQDFRKSTWLPQLATINGGTVTGSIALPESGFRAFFAELEYESEGLAYYLSTQVRILAKTGQ